MLTVIMAGLIRYHASLFSKRLKKKNLYQAVIREIEKKYKNKKKKMKNEKESKFSKKINPSTLQ